jgi:MFS family permease
MSSASLPYTRNALEDRNFRLLWGGQAVSLAGNGLFTVALPLEVLHLTGSPLDLALVVSGRTIPAVFLLLFAGTFVDRLSRRLVMVISDTVCGISVCLAAMVIIGGHARVWQLFMLTLVFGIAAAFFKPAATAIVRDILPRELFASASSLTSLSQSLGQYLFGPAVGGLAVVAVGAGWTFALDGLSFGVSAVCLLAMRNISEVRADGSRLLTGIAQGLRYCFSQRWLWCSLIAVGIANLSCVAPFVILEPLLVKQVFHAGPLWLGFMYAASGGGGALASLLAARRPAPVRKVAVMWKAWAGSGLSALCVGLSPFVWLSVVFAGVTWGLLTYGNIIWTPLLQRETPGDMLGRVSSIDWLFSLALIPLGTIAGGAAAAAIGVRLTVISSGAIAIATGSVLLIPGVTDPDRREVERLASLGQTEMPGQQRSARLTCLLRDRLWALRVSHFRQQRERAAAAIGVERGQALAQSWSGDQADPRRRRRRSMRAS